MFPLNQYRFQLGKFRPPQELSSERGNFSGMQIQLLRALCGFVHELLKLVRQAARSSAAYQTLVSSLEPVYRKAWEEIVEAATSSDLQAGIIVDATSSLRHQLRHLRNKAGHHWDPLELAKAYAEFFSRTPHTPHNSAAYFSLGGNLEGSRLFFADAAAEELIRKTTGDSLDPWLERFNSTCQGINVGLRGFLTTFIRHCSQRGTAVVAAPPDDEVLEHRK